jgi:hypothetical protein
MADASDSKSGAHGREGSTFPPGTVTWQALTSIFSLLLARAKTGEFHIFVEAQSVGCSPIRFFSASVPANIDATIRGMHSFSRRLRGAEAVRDALWRAARIRRCKGDSKTGICAR